MRTSGATTVFLFAHDLVASVTRPVLELKRYQPVALKTVIEPGRMEIYVGFGPPADFPPASGKRTCP